MLKEPSPDIRPAYALEVSGKKGSKKVSMQQKGIDFKETFSSVVRYDSLRVLLAVVTEKDMKMAQFDVQTAFLYRELEEEVCMEVPEGIFAKQEELSIKDKKNFDCRLQKALYGLKQVPRNWNKTFCDFFKLFNFQGD